MKKTIATTIALGIFCLSASSFAQETGPQGPASTLSYTGTSLPVNVSDENSSVVNGVFLGNTYTSTSYELPPLGTRANTVEIALGDFAQTAIHLGGIQSFIKRLMKATPTVDEKAVYKQQAELLTPILHSIENARISTQGVQDDSKKLAADLAAKNAELAGKNASLSQEVSALKKQVGSIGNRLSDFYNPQARFVFIAKDASSPNGLKPYYVSNDAGTFHLGEAVTPYHINYNTVWGTDSKLINIWTLRSMNFRVDDQNGYASMIYGAYNVTKVDASSLSTGSNNVADSITELDGQTGYLVVFSQLSDPLPTKELVHQNLQFRGVNKKSDRDALIEFCANN